MSRFGVPADRPLTLLVAAKLRASLLERYLEPLQRWEGVGRILLVRQAPIGNRLGKVENLAFGDAGAPRGMLRMLAAVDRTLRREEVDWVLGFNPVPWASLAGAAAVRHRTPFSLSFIGSDFKQMQSPLALPLWLAVRHARIVTVTGEAMRRGLLARGVPAAKIRVLPHVVDTERFAPGAAEPDLDVVSVGSLIRRKRLDVVIDAVARLRDRGVFVRAGILGEGPLRADLERQVGERRLADRVELLGFRDDVETVLRRGRLFALVSEWEGLPFALIEALCCGLVPVVTHVGTVADWIQHGRNGHVVPVGDATSLAASIEGLLGDRAQLGALRAAALGLRPQLSLERGAAFWREALRASEPPS